MPPRKPAKKDPLTLIVPDEPAGDRTTYVYRDNGKGGPMGKYLIKTADNVTHEQIRKHHGPGHYVAMSDGGDQPFHTERIWVKPTDETEPDEKTKPTAAGFIDPEWIESRKQLAMLRMIEREASGETNAIELAKQFAEIFAGIKTGGAAGHNTLDTFLQGVEFGGDTATPSDPLTNALGAMVPRTDGAAESKRIAALLHRQNQLLAEQVKDLAAELKTLRSELTSAQTAVYSEAETVTDEREILVESLRQVAAAGIEDIAAPLTDLVSSAPPVAAVLLGADPDETHNIVAAALTAAGKPELIPDWVAAIQKVRKGIAHRDTNGEKPGSVDDRMPPPEKTP